MSEKRILAMGNEAIALGAVRAGVRMAAGYPGHAVHGDPGDSGET